MPIYNEELFLKRALTALLKLDLAEHQKEIILIDDGSKDKSREILKQFEKILGLIIIYRSKNSGKGAALRDGFKASSGDIIFIQDADLEYNLEDIKNIIPLYENNLADVVYGSRFVSQTEHRVLYYWHSVANKILTTFSNMLTNLNLSDIESCRKSFRKEVIDMILPRLKSRGFEIEAEITALIAKKHWRVYEVGISYHGRTYQEGKKIKFKDSLKALVTIIRCKFVQL